ncbi:hypothetical protein FKM82_023587, partial [Ascaphus truei]
SAVNNYDICLTQGVNQCAWLDINPLHVSTVLLLSYPLPASCTLLSTISTISMSFSGTWQVYAQENYENFLRAVGLPDDIIKIAKDVNPVIEIQQNGDTFVVTSKTPKQSTANTFTVGKESEITTVDGKKIKVT